MPRRKPKDENEMAFGVRQFTEQMADQKPENRAALASAAAKALSMLGASKGGKARAASLTAHRRKEIAIKAAKTRWKEAKNK